MSNNKPIAPVHRRPPPQGNDYESRMRRLVLGIMQRDRISFNEMAERCGWSTDMLRKRLYGPQNLDFVDAELLLLVLGFEAGEISLRPIIRTQPNREK